MRGHFSPSDCLTPAGLAAEGLWDLDRLTQPFMPAWHARSVLGSNFEAVAAILFAPLAAPAASAASASPSADATTSSSPYVTAEPNTPLAFADGLTEAAAHAILADHGLTSSAPAVSELFNNVLLLRDEHDADRLFPRFGCFETVSFQQLPYDGWKRAVERMHQWYFYEGHSETFAAAAHAKLPALLSATDMLVCGEDLGLLHPVVAPIMRQYGILGLRVQRMPAETHLRAYHPADYGYDMVCTTSTHDMPPIAAMWAEGGDLVSHIWHDMLGNYGPVPHKLPASEARRIVDMHAFSPAAVCVLPIQDYLATSRELAYHGNPQDEIINVPANRWHYWRWRMHLSVEQLLEATEFCHEMRRLHASCRRC
jgi:4-alpha-glucanotransferase